MTSNDPPNHPAVPSAPSPSSGSPRWRPGRKTLIAVAVGFAAVGFAAAALLANIFQRKQEAKNPYLRLVEVSEPLP